MDRQCVGRANTHLLKSKCTCRNAIYQAFANNGCKKIVFDPVIQQLPDLTHAAETTTRENCQLPTTELNKKCPLQSSDVAEHASAAKWPKANGKKVQTKLMNIIKNDTMAHTLHSIT